VTAFVVISLSVALLALALRRSLAKRGSGRLAQVAFRKEHGATVARLLDGEVDPRPHSPWIAIELDGRPAKLVAAPIPGGRMQAGIELFERSIPVNIWFTNGAREEIEHPDTIDEDDVLAIVAKLAAADVDSLSTGLPIAHEGPPHILRIQFDEVADLPGALARVAPLLTELEQLGIDREL